MVAIRVMLMKQVGSRRIDAPEHRITWHDRTVVTDRHIEVSPSDFLLPSSRDRHTDMLAEFLSNVMGVPQVEQPTIIDRIFLAVELADIPDVPVTCLIVDATVFLMGDEQTIRDRVSRESRLRNKPLLSPATESSIQGLEKVRPDMLEATIRQTRCVVCKEGLDHFDDDHGVEEGIDRDQVMITRLPCSHLFHGDCIVPWLEKSHLCPLCRYAMPTIKEEEEDEPSKPSGPSWPMLLTVSANVIAAVLLCGVLKQS